MTKKIAFLFPGQGAQFVGMGKEIFDHFSTARHIFEEVDEALKQSLSKIILHGPENELTLTENTQPALMATSLAVLRCFEKESNTTLSDIAFCAAGHSLGEYSALAAANVMPISTTAQLVRTRGKAMQDAVPFGQGAMAALLGCTIEEAHAILEEASQGDVCDMANDNAIGQVVISGHIEAIDRACDLALSQNKKAVKLNVSAPFHSKLMQPAANIMEETLKGITMSSPSVPIITNVQAHPVTDPSILKQGLVDQVSGQVRWRESIQHMITSGVDLFVECGPGRVLSGLVKRIDRSVSTMNIHTPADLDAALEKILVTPA